MPAINTVWASYVQCADFHSSDMRFPTMWYVRPAKSQIWPQGYKTKSLFSDSK